MWCAGETSLSAGSGGAAVGNLWPREPELGSVRTWRPASAAYSDAHTAAVAVAVAVTVAASPGQMQVWGK